MFRSACPFIHDHTVVLSLRPCECLLALRLLLPMYRLSSLETVREPPLPAGHSVLPLPGSGLVPSAG